jgi:tetratricopeptide (TPR) repeat protein
MARTALDRAERLFSAGRYAEVVSLLEPQVPVYRESSRFYYVLGSACLRSGDYSGASAYLRRAEQLDPGDADTVLALAALDLRKGDTEKALAAYLRVLDERPGNRLASLGLATIRKQGSPEELAALAKSGKMARLYPGGRSVPRAVVVGAVAVLVVVLAFMAAPSAARLAKGIVAGGPKRPEVAAVSLNESEKAAPVSAGGTFKYALTESQALDAFERAKSFFQEYRDNAALVEINRLMGSNASRAVKQKAQSLKAFVGAPDFRTIRDAPSFADLAGDPGLYDGCSVAWKGMAANVRPKDAGSPDAAALAFDFLVGYQDKKKLEGIIPASIGQGPVPVDRPLEMLAIIRSADGVPRLDCVAIHELLGGGK